MSFSSPIQTVSPFLKFQKISNFEKNQNSNSTVALIENALFEIGSGKHLSKRV